MHGSTRALPPRSSGSIGTRKTTGRGSLPRSSLRRRLRRHRRSNAGDRGRAGTGIAFATEATGTTVGDDVPARLPLRPTTCRLWKGVRFPGGDAFRAVGIEWQRGWQRRFSLSPGSAARRGAAPAPYKCGEVPKPGGGGPPHHAAPRDARRFSDDATDDQNRDSCTFQFDATQTNRSATLLRQVVIALGCM